MKKTIILLTLWACIIVAGCSSQKTVSPTDHKGSDTQWLTFRGNAAGGAGTTDEVIKPPLGLMWKQLIPGGFRSSPVVDAERVYIGSLDGNVYAFNRRNGGKPVWTFKTKGRVLAPPVVDNGILYIGSEDGFFYAIDAKTGKQLQNFATENNRAIHAAAIVTKDLVIFGALDNYIYALPKSDFSRIEWQVHTGDWIEAAPMLDGDFVYIGSNDGKLYKIRLTGNSDAVYETGETPETAGAATGTATAAFATVTHFEDSAVNVTIKGRKPEPAAPPENPDKAGAVVWSFTTGGPVYSTPVISGGKIYFTSWDGYTYAVRAKDKKLLWRTKVDEQASASLALKNGKLFGGGMFNGPFFALRASDGKQLFNFDTAGGFDASPVIAGDVLFIGSFDYHIYGLDINSYKIIWKQKLRDPVRATCAVADGTLFAADMKGRLYAFAPIH